MSDPRRAPVQERAEELAARGVFLGGWVAGFEHIGRSQLVILLEHGLRPDSNVLDVGCGCLRGGYWIIRFLDPGRYFGIEPNREMLEAGLEQILEPGLEAQKRPRFDHNEDFDLTVFDASFDFVIARSVWTHSSKQQIAAMLDGFCETAAPGARMLTSYLPANPLSRDYRGSEWVGRSHRSAKPGVVHHSRRWIRRECERRGLELSELRSGRVNRQRWLRIDAPGAATASSPAQPASST